MFNCTFIVIIISRKNCFNRNFTCALYNQYSCLRINICYFIVAFVKGNTICNRSTSFFFFICGCKNKFFSGFHFSLRNFNTSFLSSVFIKRYYLWCLCQIYIVWCNCIFCLYNIYIFIIIVLFSSFYPDDIRTSICYCRNCCIPSIWICNLASIIQLII